MDNNTAPNCFIDGNTVFLTLESTNNFYQTSFLVIEYLRQVGKENVVNILLDCADLENSSEMFANELIRFEESLKISGIRLLILDFPNQARSHLQELLPQSVWIDSTSAGFFGKELKRIAMSAH